MDKKQFRINGFEQINNFFATVLSGKHKFSSNHISLYLFLLYLNNKNNWEETFSCTSEFAKMGAGIGSNHTYYRIVHDLENLGLIKYQPGNHNVKTAVFHLINLCNNAPISAQISALINAQRTALISAHISALLTAPIYNDITNKLNNIITKNIETIKENSDFDFKIIFKKKRKKSTVHSPQSTEKKEEGGGAKKSEALIMPFSSDEFLYAWNNFLEMRQKKNKSVKTHNSKQLILAKIKKLSAANESKAIELINQSTEKEWLGIFPLEDLTPKTNNYGRKNNNSESVTDSIKRGLERFDALCGRK